MEMCISTNYWTLTAKDSGLPLIDEFDTMMAAMEPLWGVTPADIYGRVEYALNAGHMSMISLCNHEPPTFVFDGEFRGVDGRPDIWLV